MTIHHKILAIGKLRQGKRIMNLRPVQTIARLCLKIQVIYQVKLSQRDIRFSQEGEPDLPLEAEMESVSIS